MNTAYQRFQFSLLIGSVFICGAAEGMLLPLIASLLETNGVSAILNGLGSTSLYIGMLVSVPLMEKPMRRLGYKRFLIAGLALITLPLFLFPVWMNLWFWFVLRLFVGFGDSMLHFAAQTWITMGSPLNRRGRNIAFYGLAFGLGIAVGPMLVRLISFGVPVPFITSGVFCFIVLLLLLLLNNEYPELSGTNDSSARQFFIRYKKVIAATWSGLMVTFAFGYLETSLTNSFPIFALRQGYNLNAISILLPAFVTGGLLTQVPLGMIGDRFGRARLLPLICLLGSGFMALAGVLSAHFYGIYFTLLGSGLLIGSLYSMSMGYVSDLLDKEQIPLGNILMTVCYSAGCMIGPVSGNTLISLIPKGGLFYGIAFLVLLASFSCFIQQASRRRKALLDHSLTRTSVFNR
ncbi:MFS transporter [Sporolactobacillus sp. STCC-11]|uniref:MFS transporter n=1 Tax=Sporolactobacillus caesalpiniae TaxID=3230362 RepID=UPI00339865F6